MATLLTKEVVVKSNGGSSNAYKFKLEVIENSTNIANNTSNVTINHYGACYSSAWGFNTFSGITSKVNIDGTDKDSASVSAISSTSYKKLSTWTGDIKHDDDGKKSITAKGIFSHSISSSSYGYIPASNTIQGTVTLTTIPRKSSFSATNAEIEGTCKISIKRAAAFTHTLKYSFEGLTGTIAAKVGTSYTWTIPTNFYEKIIDSKTGKCTITCETYNGSTKIGTTTKTITISCNESKCKPTVNGTIVDTNATTIALTGDSTKLVKYKSTAKVTGTASPKNSASIKSITVDSKANPLTVSKVSKNSFVVTAKDSRGFTNSATKTTTMINYIILSCKASFERVSQTDSEIILSYSGNFFNGSFGKVSNTLTCSWKGREKGTSEWKFGGTLTPNISGNTFSGRISCGSGYDYQKNYEFILYYADKIDSLNTGTTTVTKGVGALEIYEKAILANGEVLAHWEEDKVKLGDNVFNVLFKTKTIDLATNITIPAKFSIPTQTSGVPFIQGYKACLVMLNNAWMGPINLWYLNLNDDGTGINWRAYNSDSSEKTVTIRVKVLYIKNELVEIL